MAANTAIEDQKTPARAWLILAVVYIASFMAPMAQFKVPALADWIIPEMLVPMTGGDPVAINTYFGLLMSALAIIGVILAFPAAAVSRRLGLKTTMAISIVCLAVGTFVFAITDNYYVVIVGRMIEGLGIGLIGVVAPTCVSIWFPTKTRGTALGIWASWFPLGITLMFNVAPMVAANWGWRTILWACLICDIVALVLFLVVFKMPERGGEEEGNLQEEQSLSEGWKYLKNGKLWILAAIFFIFNFIQLGAVNSYYNQFLSAAGMTSQAANSVTSVMTALGILTIPIGGILYDRIKYKNKNRLMIGTYILWILALIPAFQTGGDGTVVMACMWFFIIVMGIANGSGAGSLRPYAPSLVPNTTLGAGMAMALLQFMQNLGSAIGSPVYGAIVGAFGWQSANFGLLIPLCVIAIVLALFLKPKKAKIAQEGISKE